MLTNDQQILNDIAHALTDHMATETGAGHFVDLTTGETTFIQSEYMFNKNNITEEKIARYTDWEQDEIRTYLEHDLIQIKLIPSYESFRVMEAFADTRSGNEQNRLYRVLQGQRPFANFRYACIDLGILQQWYDFQNDAENRLAQDWLKDNDLEIKDGKIVRITG